MGFLIAHDGIGSPAIDVCHEILPRFPRVVFMRTTVLLFSGIMRDVWELKNGSFPNAPIPYNRQSIFRGNRIDLFPIR